MQQGSDHGDDESPFFADMTLDLAEAHDIAETPQPRKLILDETAMGSAGSAQLHIPSLGSSMDSISESMVPPMAATAGTQDPAGRFEHKATRCNIVPSALLH